MNAAPADPRLRANRRSALRLGAVALVFFVLVILKYTVFGQ